MYYIKENRIHPQKMLLPLLNVDAVAYVIKSSDCLWNETEQIEWFYSGRKREKENYCAPTILGSNPRSTKIIKFSMKNNQKKNHR